MRAGTGRRSTILKSAVFLAAALVLGLLLICKLSVPSSPSPSAELPPATGGSQAKREAGVSFGFPETGAGAAAAIAAYQQAFAQPSVLRPGVLRARIAAVATPAYAPRMLAANGPGQTRIAAGPVGVGLENGVRTIFKAVPIGYKVLSFARGRAEVETWGLTIVGNLGSVEPTLWFGTSRTTLTWHGDRWRIADVESGFGPTPAIGTRPDPAAAYRVIELAKELKGYAVAP
jgi:hypothetical protein